MPIRENDESDEAVAERIRAAMAVRGITNPVLSKKLGYKTSSTVSNWTTARNPPKRAEAFKLCDALGITLEWLYRGRTGGMDWDTVQALETAEYEPVVSKPQPAEKAPSKKRA